jgi:hypothetical protein
MPPENRVGRDDRGDLMKSATAQPVSVHCQPTPFLIGQTDPAAQVRAKNAVFFDQIGNRLLPPVGPPTGHSHHEESNRSDIHNRGSLHYRLHGAPESTSAENWDTTGATAGIRPYDVTADGQRFLMVKQKDRAPISASQMILVQNWLEELKARVPTR